MSSEAKASAMHHRRAASFVAGAVSVTSPAYLAPLVTTSVGLVCLGVAGLMLATGIFVMNRMIQFDYLGEHCRVLYRYPGQLRFPDRRLCGDLRRRHRLHLRLPMSSSVVERKDRIKKVALEREQMRAKEMARLRAGPTPSRRPAWHQAAPESKSYMKAVVERFSLQKAFMDENTVDKLAQAGQRGQAPLTRFLFLRFVTPFILFALAVFYLVSVTPGGRPLYINVLYSVASVSLAPTCPICCSKTVSSSASNRSSRPGPIASI